MDFMPSRQFPDPAISALLDRFMEGLEACVTELAESA
jgi:hypothetical protein